MQAYTTHVPTDSELHALDVAAGDFDRDGDVDVALAVEGGVNRYYRNDGAGRFVHVEGIFGNVPHDSEYVDAADFDGDGLLDLVFVAEDDEQHQLFLGRGDGTFLDVTERLPARSEGNALAVGDVNRDVLPDIVVGNSNEGGGDPANFLWVNDAASPGHFIDRSSTALPRDAESTQSVALADLDADGDLDMVVGNQTPPNRLLRNDGTGVPGFAPLQVRAWRNDGQGHYSDVTASVIPDSAVGRTWGMARADFDGDGHDDLFLGQWGTQARLLLSRESREPR